MKRLTAILLSLALIFCFALTAMAEDDDLIVFTPSFANALNDSSTSPDSSWVSTSYNRALLTVLLCLDADFDSSRIDFTNSYVGIDDNFIILIIGYKYSGAMMVLYNPAYSNYSYYNLGGCSDADIEFFANGLYSQANIKYNKNSTADILTVISDLTEIFSE